MTELLTQLTKDYITETDELIAARRPGEGIFGLPDSAKSAPCHMEYYNKMEAAVRELAGDEPDPETAEQLVRFLLTAEEAFPCSKLSSWTLLAVQRLSVPLIPYLSEDKRKELCVWFGKKVPRLQRMPVQQEIFKALKK